MAAIWPDARSWQSVVPWPGRRHFRPVAASPAQASARSRTGQQVLRLCHNQRLKTAGIALDTADTEHVFNSAETWEKVIVKLRSRAMPPLGMPRPDNATYDEVAAWLETELDRAARPMPNPGRPADLHRLNRTEYANAVRDLIGVEVDATAMLPPDEQAYGFDTNADALSMQPALLDRYLLRRRRLRASRSATRRPARRSSATAR